MRKSITNAIVGVSYSSMLIREPTTKGARVRSLLQRTGSVLRGTSEEVVINSQLRTLSCLRITCAPRRPEAQVYSGIK